MLNEIQHKGNSIVEEVNLMMSVSTVFTHAISLFQISEQYRLQTSPHADKILENDQLHVDVL